MLLYGPGFGPLNRPSFLCDVVSSLPVTGTGGTLKRKGLLLVVAFSSVCVCVCAHARARARGLAHTYVHAHVQC